MPLDGTSWEPRMQAERWKKIEELYQAALAGPPETRTEFLKRACTDHPSLQREIEPLLKLAAEAGPFLEDSPISSLRDDVPAFPGGYKLGNFEILEPIGRGGMGEVYLARDTRLKREVAIKVLPSAFSGDAARKARLEREARILAALNHPRIASIYGVEATGDGYALAMEYVPGPTLEDRIARGAIPMPEAIALAIQIAEGLEYAHDKGVIHRDLKPANIKVTPDGQVKVLDFGLAKVDGPATESIDGSNPGFILGTAAYMAPEQARGQTVDKRADVWAFGVIFYEMVMGKRPAPGEPVSDPDWPQAIGTMLRRCLAQDPKRRLRDIGDARNILEEYLAEPQPETPRAKPPSRGMLPWMIAAASALGLEGRRSVWIYSLAQDTMTLVAAGKTKSGLAWSPDGKRIAVGLVDGIYLMMSDGSGKAERLTQGTSHYPGSFAPDGKRLAYSDSSADTSWDLWTVPLEFDALNHVKPGKPELFLRTDEAEGGPQFSPDGRWIAYTSNESGSFEVYVRPFPAGTGASGGMGQISSGGGWFAVWSRDGKQIFY
jgi:serine/threonine protein kinase